MTVPKKKDPIEQTREKIKSGDAKIGIIGLGYVGLPLALVFSDKFPVVGYDADEKKSKMLKQGRSYIDDISDKAVKDGLGNGFRIAEGYSKLRECDAVIICVPTPLDKRGYPDLSFIAHSSNIVEKIVRKGMLVVLESTSYPGTTEEYLGRAIRRAGLTPGKDVALAFSPERVDPGNKKYNIRNTPKVVGGVDVRSTEIASDLYSAIVDAGVVRVRDCSTAEAVKIVENIFRGVNIALINELALIFERMGIDTWEVIKAASTKPFAFMAHYPGPGVGGHCIPLDPMYLSYKAKQYGMVPRFIELSHEVNEFMKHHTVNLTMAALKKAGLDKEKATVTVMGVAYKKDISDTRESPAAEIIEELTKRVHKVLVHDPKAKYITTPVGTFRSVPMKKVMAEADCLVFVTNHSQYEKLKPKDLLGRHVKAVVDTRNLFDSEAVEKVGLVYKGIGK
jgi:UDP-N-acetyl-D-glucosamine dehydrogenase